MSITCQLCGGKKFVQRQVCAQCAEIWAPKKKEQPPTVKENLTLFFAMLAASIGTVFIAFLHLFRAMKCIITKMQRKKNE